MKKTKIESNFRGNGDCRIARGNQAYGLFFEQGFEVNEITRRIFEHFKSDFADKQPRVILTGRNTKNLMGTANYYMSRIRLHNPGANVGCLIHELAHLFKITRLSSAHSPIFKECQTKIYRFWNTIKDEYFTKATIGTDSPRQLLNAGRQRGSGLTMISANGLRSFRYGERVWFVSRKKGVKVEGVVLRINTKTISVKEDNKPAHQYWRVTPGMLHKTDGKKTGFYKPLPTPTVTVPTPEPPKPIVDTADEIKELIEFAIDKLSKYAVYNTLSMPGIVRTFHARGIMNNDENRKYAIDYVKSLGLNIR